MKLRSKLSIADCRVRLGSATDLRGFALSWDANGPEKVVGEFRGNVFRLHTRKYYDNSFAPFFYGKLRAVDNGSILEGCFRLHPFVRLFTLFWYSFILIFAAGALMVLPPRHPVAGFSRGWYFVVLGVLAVLGGGLVQVGKWLARSEQEVIRSFLKSALEAEDA
jgi:hypothetical protein